MGDNVRLEAVSEASQSRTISYLVNSTRQRPTLLMTHSSRESMTVPPMINIEDYNFSTRNEEQYGRLNENVPSGFEEFRSHVERMNTRPGVSLGTLPRIDRPHSQMRTPPALPDSHIIIVEDQPTIGINTDNMAVGNPHHNETMNSESSFLRTLRQATHEITGQSENASNNNNNNSSEDDSTRPVRINLEIWALLKLLQRYIPFILILLAKSIYDLRKGILNFIVLFTTFIYANNVLRREIAKQQNKSWMSLLVITCYIVACIVFIKFKCETHIFSTYTQPLTIWELLWSVLVTDFVLKLITIIFKAILTCLPVRFLALQKRGKYYFMVEATSQLYRCVVPVQPWLYYFFEAYQGPEKVFGIFLSVLYTISKGSDLLSRFKLFRTAIWKLLQNVNLGSSPSKEQLLAFGGVCPICHEQFSVPVRLLCKHIFCEVCISTWLDRERTCPLCRAGITDEPIYRDGSTAGFIQLY